jgi:ABC-type transporter Mla subunit MlaD
MYLELDPGTRSSGILKPAVIPSSQTSVAVDIADVLDAFNADQRQRLTTLLDQLSRGLPDGGIRLQQSFAQLVPLMQDSVEITQQIDSEHRELAAVVHNLGQITGVLANHDQQLANLVTNGAGTLNTLAVNDYPLDATVRDLPATVAALHSGLADVADSIGAINPALYELRPAARALAPALTALTGFANQARPALTALSPAADALVPLSGALNKFAGAAQRATRSLLPETATIDGLTATTDRCMDPLAAFIDRFISANKLGNSKGAWWRVQIVANGQSGSPIKTCADGGAKR